jgi:hypothetical protein
LNPETLQVYVEAAPLGDYWDNLGQYKKRDDPTGTARKEVLSRLLAPSGMSVDDPVLAKEVFLTVKNLFISPGHWSVPREIEQERRKALLEIKWAFNAKPDFLLLSGQTARPTHGLMIEAKVESKETSYSYTDGENEKQMTQSELQKKIASLLHEHVPYFHETRFEQMLLLKKNTAEGNSALMWIELATLVDTCTDGPNEGIGKFCRDGFRAVRDL